MNHRVLFIVLGVFLHGISQGQTEAVCSPDNNIEVTVSVVGGRLTYSLHYKNSVVIEESALGLMVDEVELGQGVVLGPPTRYGATETFPWRGTHSVAINHYNGGRFPVTQAGGLPFSFDVRVFNNGVAFSYRIPGAGSHVVKGESTTFAIPAGSTVWTQPAFDKYEGNYATHDISSVQVGAISGPPLTIRLPGNLGYAAITEGGLVNYSGMHLRCNASRSYQAILSGTSLLLSGPIQTPWRVIMIGSLNALVNCDIPACVSSAPDASLFPNGLKTDWIKPGRSSWSWLTSTRAITLANMKSYETYASQLGIEYNIVDEGWQKWSDKYSQLAELCAFGKSLAPPVNTWVWVNYIDIADEADRRRFFADCKTAGVVGVKIDFMDAETKARVDFQYAALRDAADYHLMVDFHGVGKPTGEARTYPNEMTREAVRGKEGRPGAGHSVLIPFTRGLAGSTDYTPMDLDGSWPNHGTVANEIASAICITSALLVFSEDPATIATHPFVSLVRDIPSTWDKTIVLPQSSIGEVASFARRKGTKWFVAVMNNPTPRDLMISLSFLEPGKIYSATIVKDSSKDFERRKVSTRDTLIVSLEASGGFVAELDESVPGDGSISPKTADR